MYYISCWLKNVNTFFLIRRFVQFHGSAFVQSAYQEQTLRKIEKDFDQELIMERTKKYTFKKPPGQGTV